MTDINSFGSVMAFAIALEAQLRDLASAVGQTDYAAACEKRRSTLERVRRENVTEIKLEPITDLTEEQYAIDAAADVKAAAGTAARFYTDAAPKINVREAQRALERCAKQHTEFVG